ncbi:MAG: zinc-ribbon domain-containing protein, partial [Paracoccaceae bacterium]|nr:zinc-ribbon domain-containing protein [Paracoccaceae bacterium]
MIEEPKMLLLCPNCGAQYEVPEDHIPKKYGRDVQCSACNHTWFQTHPAQDLQPTSQDKVDGLDLPKPAEQGFKSLRGDDLEAGSPAPSAGAGPQMPPLRQKRSLHPSVAGVLREEAKREVEERGINSAQVPDNAAVSQPNSEAASSSPVRSGSSDQARDADMDMQALEELYQNSEKTAKSTRGALLPDIDEINSTLSTSGAEWPSDSDASKEIAKK